MKNCIKNVSIVISLGFCLSAPAAFADETCTYSDWAWDTVSGKAVDFETIQTTRDQLTEEQLHPDLPCSICEEDMEDLKIDNLAPIKVCAAVASAIRGAIRQSINEGFPIRSLTGYRVGRTKGPTDSQGRRTQYSHHSFGLAIDINADANGLYGTCVEFGPNCRLRRGGEWDPSNPESITPDRPVYRAFREIGFRWRGELNGRQKDFMHFSLSGD